MPIDVSTRESYEENGYAIIRNYLDLSVLNEIRDEVSEIGRIIVGPEFEFNVFKPDLITPAKQSMLYDRLHYLPSLNRLSGNKQILSLCHELGIKTPILMGCCNMRYDKPHDTKHLFEWHQDTLYLLGSINAVTLWIPFGVVDKHHGTIQVIPGSHKNGIYPFKKISDKAVEKDRPFLQRDLSIDYDVTENPVTIEAEFGDIVIFKQMLLHKSWPNYSNKVRWTSQLRISDLSSDEFLAQGCPTGDKKNIFFQNYPGFKHPESIYHETKQQNAAR
jgi:ectoine hydroxylase-related dioxygenase (phytanoyl-CoA dioxygenase family)